MDISCWYKTTFRLNALDTQLSLGVAHDLFSTVSIDEGTLLLLEHLPPNRPDSVLDLGCGYGALGLPVAARFPQARVEMVDRDLLAVAMAQRNAQQNGLSHAQAYGSLGYRDLLARQRPFDWILCNVPARIGRPFIAHLLQAGRAMLAPEGELRVVVIRDLAPTIEALRNENGWPLVEEARGPRHTIFSLKPETLDVAPFSVFPVPDDGLLYGRDEIEMKGLFFQRPTDLGGDDPKRLSRGLPVLLDGLPRQPPQNVFVFRCGYGILPLVARSLWPPARVVATDRDLLATTFTRRNAARLGLGGERLEVREAGHFPDALAPGERFDLLMGEISPSAGERVAAAEIQALAKATNRRGQALLLVLEKLERTWLRTIAQKTGILINRVIAREGYALVRLAPLL